MRIERYTDEQGRVQVVQVDDTEVKDIYFDVEEERENRDELEFREELQLRREHRPGVGDLAEFLASTESGRMMEDDEILALAKHLHVSVMLPIYEHGDLTRRTLRSAHSMNANLSKSHKEVRRSYVKQNGEINALRKQVSSLTKQAEQIEVQRATIGRQISQIENLKKKLHEYKGNFDAAIRDAVREVMTEIQNEKKEEA